MRASVIVLGFGEEPHLSESLAAILGSIAPGDEVVLVDNGIADDARRGLPHDDRLRVVDAGGNRGFAGGCNLGARRAVGDTLVFVNSDVVVAPDAIGRLVAAVDDPAIGLACAELRLADQPGTLNCAGNPMHFLGIVWSGGFGDAISLDESPRAEVAAASGAFFAIRADRWRALDGFAPEYFAYHEDADLSLRAWLRGWPVVVEPRAVGYHHYDFGRNPRKLYLLERNRWITVLCDFPLPVLLAALPALVLAEVGLAALAVSQGWFGQKARAWGWLSVHPRWLLRRRRVVSRTRTLSVGTFAGLLADRLEPAMIARPRALSAVDWALARYWSLVRGLARWGRPAAGPRCEPAGIADKVAGGSR